MSSLKISSFSLFSRVKELIRFHERFPLRFPLRFHRGSFFFSSPLRPRLQRNVSVAAIHGDRTQTEREEARNAERETTGCASWQQRHNINIQIKSDKHVDKHRNSIDLESIETDENIVFDQPDLEESTIPKQNKHSESATPANSEFAKLQLLGRTERSCWCRYGPTLALIICGVTTRRASFNGS